MLHVIASTGLPSSSRNICEATPRDLVIKQMADHIVAAVIEGMSTANTLDVFNCLYNSPDRYHHRVVNDHMDDALVEGKRILGEMYEARYRRQHDAVAAEMSDRS